MLDEIDQVGPGGHFLDTAQTLSRFRDFWYPGLLDRSIRSTWLDRGATSLGERLNAKVKSILTEHQPKPLEPDKKQQVREILAQAAGQSSHQMPSSSSKGLAGRRRE
jgi:trimethylamine--corrinoid protein Co-methyltransferase